MKQANFAVSGAFWVFAVGCGVVVGLADLAGLLIARAIQKKVSKGDIFGRVQFVGPALEREEPELEAQVTPIQSPSSQTPDLASPPQGILVPLLVTGLPGCGKTTLAKIFVTGSLPAPVQSTVGGDLFFKTVPLGRHRAYVQIWEVEIPSPEEQSSPGSNRQSGNGRIFVYNTKQHQTFDALKAWHALVTAKPCKRKEDYVLVVLGNPFPVQQEGNTKPGSKDITEMLSEVEAFCKAKQMAHFLLSAEDDLRTVQSAFEYVIDKSLHKSLQKRKIT